MEEIADAWWDKYGQDSMKHYFTEMKAKASKHIGEAVGSTHELKDEQAIKHALAHALAEGDADLIAEVIHETVEWVNADSGLRSIARG
jgi:DNA-binding phage protein